MLLGNGKSYLLALIALLVIELGERIGKRLVVHGAVATGIDGQIDSLAQSGFIGLVLACDVERRILQGLHTHQWQAGSYLYPTFGRLCQEWRHTLVVIHGQDATRGLEMR